MTNAPEGLTPARVVWFATGLAGTGDRGVPNTTSVRDFLARFDELLALGEGHVEVGHACHDFPTLSVAFREGFAVVHCFGSVESSSLLVGDPGVSGGEDVALTLVEEGDGLFSAEFIHSTEAALDVVRRFVGGASPEELGEWYAL